MDLDLDIGHRGRPGVTTVEILGPVRESDLALLGAPRPSDTSALARLTNRHHSAARAIAQGLSQIEVAALTGYTPERVYQLQQDSAFADLVAHYRKQINEEFGDLQVKLKSLSHTAVDILNDRLEDKPDEFDAGALIEIGKFAADRSGNGPQTKSTNINFNVDLAGRLQTARQRERERNVPRTLELEPASPGTRSEDEHNG